MAKFKGNLTNIWRMSVSGSSSNERPSLGSDVSYSLRIVCLPVIPVRYLPMVVEVGSLVHA